MVCFYPVIWFSFSWSHRSPRILLEYLNSHVWIWKMFSPLAMSWANKPAHWKSMPCYLTHTKHEETACSILVNDSLSYCPHRLLPKSRIQAVKGILYITVLYALFWLKDILGNNQHHSSLSKTIDTTDKQSLKDEWITPPFPFTRMWC